VTHGFFVINHQGSFGFHVFPLKGFTADRRAMQGRAVFSLSSEVQEATQKWAKEW
jgi:hypothetical protein